MHRSLATVLDSQDVPWSINDHIKLTSAGLTFAVMPAMPKRIVLNSGFVEQVREAVPGVSFTHRQVPWEDRWK